MDNGHKILGGLLTIAIIIILLMRSCGDKGQSFTEVITVIDSVTVIDTVRFDTTAFKYITVKIPMPYYDTIRIPTPAGNYFDEFDDDDVKYLAIYEDTIKNDTISIYYRAKVRGSLEELTLGYKIFTPYYIEKTTTIQTEVTRQKRFQGFYIGMDIDIGNDGFKRPTPVIELSTYKINYNLGYNVNDKEFRAGLRFKIGKKAR